MKAGNDIAITSITFADFKIGDTGRRIIAYFNVDAFGIEIRGCKLIRTENDGLTVSTPSLEVERVPQRRSIAFRSDATRSAVMQAARKAYRALGGADLPTWADKDQAEQ